MFALFTSIFSNFSILKYCFLSPHKNISFKNEIHKGNCVSCHYLLKLRAGRLEDETLKPLFRWIPNLALLCLARRRNSLTLKKFICDFIQFCHKNRSSVKKSQKSRFGPTLQKQHQIRVGNVRPMWSCNLRFENFRIISGFKLGGSRTQKG